MDTKESETANKTSSFSKTQTYLNKTTRSKNDSKSKKGGIKLPKLTSNTFYNSSQTGIGVNPYFEKINLKQELSQYKTEIHMKKNELQELKIKYNKLSEDNKINKMLLAKILNIDLEKEFTKEELINKLEYCELNETEKKLLKETHEIMTLKLNLEEKKLKINMQQAEKEILTKNTKAKIMNELESEFLIKCEQNKKLEKKIKKLEEIINLKQKEIKEAEKEFKTQEENNNKKNSECQKSKDDFSKKEEELNKLRIEISDLNNKHKKLKDNSNKSRKDLDRNKSIEKKKGRN